MAYKNCKNCGQEFLAVGDSSPFCSYRCRQQWNERRPRDRGKRRTLSGLVVVFFFIACSMYSAQPWMPIARGNWWQYRTSGAAGSRLELETVLGEQPCGTVRFTALSSGRGVRVVAGGVMLGICSEIDGAGDDDWRPLVWLPDAPGTRAPAGEAPEFVPMAKRDVETPAGRFPCAIYAHRQGRVWQYIAFSEGVGIVREWEIHEAIGWGADTMGNVRELLNYSVRL